MPNSPLQLSDKSQKIQQMFDKISTKYDFLNRLLSFKQDQRWRKELIKQIPVITGKDGILYDVACGTGDVILSCQTQRHDYHQAIGFDISQGMLTQAAYNCGKMSDQLKNPLISFVQASAEHLPVENNSAHCLTIAFGFRNVDNRQKALEEFYRVLKPGGKLLVLEFFPARNSFFQNLFQFYFKKILPTIGGLFSDKSAYAYLPNSVESMPTPFEFKAWLERAGFTQLHSKSWLCGSTVLFSCHKVCDGNINNK